LPFANYTELQAAVTDLLMRPDLAGAPVQDLIRLAEVRIRDELELTIQDKEVTGTLATATLALPADWVEGRLVRLDYATPRVFEFVSPTKAVDVDANTADGIPRAAYLMAKTLRFFPAPGNSVDYVMHYRAGIPFLSGGAPTNDLLTDHPNLMLYAAALESASLGILSAERENTLLQFYERARMGAKRKAFRKRTGGGVLRMRPDTFA
jgi:hypothetical protein